MARIRNITPDTLSLFRSDAPPITAGDEVTVRDETFVDRAWPKSTWDLVEPPELDGYVDQSSDDAWLYAEPAEPANDDTALVEELDGLTVAELKQRAAADGVETTATRKADLIAAIAAHHGNRHNEED